jgi:hypothetical protein
MKNHIEDAQRFAEYERLRFSIADQVAAVAGVAAIVASDIQISYDTNDPMRVHCTLTAYQNVRLHELGTQVQRLIAQAIYQATGRGAAIVDIYIRDIEQAVAKPNHREKRSEHG